MKNSQGITSETETTVTSLGELYTAAITLYRNTANTCTRLAKVMEDCRNEEAKKVFRDIVDHEKARIDHITELAQKADVPVEPEINPDNTQGLKGSMAREIADNPYLMTPYRTLRLAVINKERVFEILASLAANQSDNQIREHAEALARGALSEIAGLRLQRRRASHSEVKTAIADAGFSSPPIKMDDFVDVVRTVDAIIRTIILVVRADWADEPDKRIDTVLKNLHEDFHEFPNALVEGEAKNALEARIRQNNDNAFAALKSLLRELESAVDLFLSYAEKADNEDVVRKAQAKVEGYIKRIAIVRDQLSQISAST
jgi:hypothetical protein